MSCTCKAQLRFRLPCEKCQHESPSFSPPQRLQVDVGSIIVFQPEDPTSYSEKQLRTSCPKKPPPNCMMWHVFHPHLEHAGSHRSKWPTPVVVIKVAASDIDLGDNFLKKHTKEKVYTIYDNSWRGPEILRNDFLSWACSCLASTTSHLSLFSPLPLHFNSYFLGAQNHQSMAFDHWNQVSNSSLFCKLPSLMTVLDLFFAAFVFLLSPPEVDPNGKQQRSLTCACWLRVEILKGLGANNQWWWPSSTTIRRDLLLKQW